MRRTSHIAVRVPREKVEEAVAHYASLFGLERRDSNDGQIELVGENFTIWVDPADDHHVALQEFAAGLPAADKQRFLDRGCEVFDESRCGFHVRDPYGLAFHVWREDEAGAPE